MKQGLLQSRRKRGECHICGTRRKSSVAVITSVLILWQMTSAVSVVAFVVRSLAPLSSTRNVIAAKAATATATAKTWRLNGSMNNRCAVTTSTLCRSLSSNGRSTTRTPISHSRPFASVHAHSFLPRKRRNASLCLFAEQSMPSNDTSDGDSASTANRRRYLSTSVSQGSPSDDSDEMRIKEKESISTTWKVPDTISIPEDQLDISFVRSSGAGGQNVNKVSSCVQVRFDVKSCGAWMPLEVQRRFQTMYANQINKDGIYSIECQEHRTQAANRKTVMTKLQAAVRAAWIRPKIRQMRPEGSVSERGKEVRKNDKQKHKLKKEGRRRVDF